MSRLIIILLLILIAVAFLRSFIRKFLSSVSNPAGQKPEIKKNDNHDGQKIVDAKFEEIK